MNQDSQLELSLGEFEGVVRRLLDSCSLDDAFAAAEEANIVSIRLIELLYKGESNGGVSQEAVKTYGDLIGLCLRRFQKMIPGLNGQGWHVDLYREQMQGRLELVNQIKNYRLSP